MDTFLAMEMFIVRLWLPDRPGALGLVASRIGAVRGEIVGIEILERDAGRAIDELVVNLPDGALQSLLVQEIQQVDGVEVEEIRRVVDVIHDPRLDALETVAVLLALRDRDELLAGVVLHARRAVGAHWAAVVSLEDGAVVAQEGNAPPAPWLDAFVRGSQFSDRVLSGDSGPDDVVWSALPTAGLALVIGRVGMAYRARERRQVAALARIVDTRWGEIPRGSAPGDRPGTAP